MDFRSRDLMVQALPQLADIHAGDCPNFSCGCTCSCMTTCSDCSPCTAVPNTGKGIMGKEPDDAAELALLTLDLRNLLARHQPRPATIR